MQLWCERLMDENSLWSAHMFCFIIKTKNMQSSKKYVMHVFVAHQLSCHGMMSELRAYFAFYLIKRKYANCEKDGVSHVIFFRPKKSLFAPIKNMLPLCSRFLLLLHKLKLLFLRFEFAQESKKFQKMDIDDVQKSIWRNLFVKIDAALGVLRNFFGPLFRRPYMQWGNIHA
jgi:hypothetical protein